MGKAKNKKRKSRKGLDLLNTPERSSINTDRRSPEITVLTPTYNRPDYLRDTISSVVNQVMTDWEMMVINDGGQDVREIVKSFNDSRITYFNRKQNTGTDAGPIIQSPYQKRIRPDSNPRLVPGTVSGLRAGETFAAPGPGA